MLGYQGSRLPESKIAGSRRARHRVRDRARALLNRRLHTQVHLAHAILQVRDLRLVEVHHPLVELQQAAQKHGGRRDHVGRRSAAASSAGAIVSLQKLFATIEHPRQIIDKIAHLRRLRTKLVSLRGRVRVQFLSLQQSQIFARPRELQD